LPIRQPLLFWGGAIKRPIAMNDFPSPAFICVAGLLALLLLAIGLALDGAGLAEAAGATLGIAKGER
jgi:hypothetical protein